jgi:hypothetical protein
MMVCTLAQAMDFLCGVFIEILAEMLPRLLKTGR